MTRPRALLLFATAALLWPLASGVGQTPAPPPTAPDPADPGKATVPAGHSDAATATGQQPAPDNEKILPEVSFHDAPLRTVLQFLRDADPSFRFVAAGVAELNVQDLKLTNVTAGQTLEALTFAYPEIELNKTEPPGSPPIWVVRISADPEDAGAFTRVFRLHEVISQALSDKVGGTREAARDAVLDLMEAAFTIEANAVRADSIPKLQLHAASEVLIVRATRRQTELLNDVLKALRPDSAATNADQAQPENPLTDLRVHVAPSARPQKPGAAEGSSDPSGVPADAPSTATKAPKTDPPPRR